MRLKTPTSSCNSRDSITIYSQDLSISKLVFPSETFRLPQMMCNIRCASANWLYFSKRQTTANEAENDLTQRIVKRILKIGNGTFLPLKFPLVPLCGQNSTVLKFFLQQPGDVAREQTKSGGEKKRIGKVRRFIIQSLSVVSG
ncbi:uncharacterized protein LOC143469611 isoform X1 [Clavelina lepadiformis]|uniref:uncharacterized protein LOC143469611 isoform X1 n=1 Tax=Clavelina lepadiformis TaxID=159417 RepID=UPI004042E8CA